MEWSGKGQPNPLLNLNGDGGDGYTSTLSKDELSNVVGASKQLNCRVLSANVNKAELELKNIRLGQCLWITCGWQIILILVFSLFFLSVDLHRINEPFGMIFHVGFYFVENCFSSMISVPGIMLMILTSFKMFLVSTCITTSCGKHAESTKEQIIRYATLKSLPKPFCFAAVAWGQCLIFLQLFDQDYEKLFFMKETSDGLTNIYILETALLIRLAAVVSGVVFFLANFASGGFQLQFPSSRVRKCALDYFIDIVQSVFRSLRESFYIASIIWLTFLLIGPMLYSPFIAPIGIKMMEHPTLERVFMFLDIRFISRILLWAGFPLMTLQLDVIILSTYFLKMVNLPIERPSTTAKYLTLSEGMKGDNIFMKYLSFYEFNLKAQLGNPDVMIFFGLTHPGNHPLNWNGVFAASCDVLTELNANVIRFLRSAELSPRVLQFEGFQPYIFGMLCPLQQSSPSRNTETYLDAGSQIRSVNMKDLASNYHRIPEEGPTVYEVVKQLPTALWKDMKDACKELITWTYKELSTLLVSEKLEVKMCEKQIANCLQHTPLSLWAMKGTLELMCISVNHDPLGIVHKDLQRFIEKIVETYDVLTVLDYYMDNSFQHVDKNKMNGQIFEESADLVRKLVGASIFVLAKLKLTFSHCNKMLNMDHRLQTRIEEIISYR